MTYAVKEMFPTLQGEGMQAGRRAVFIRFAGCNLWSGLERDRAGAVCNFCDTDFVGTNGQNGGKFADAAALSDAAAGLWGEEQDCRYVVLTGGEPMLQVDDALVTALHDQGFEIAIESNGTLPVNSGIDWVCISPKSGSETVQRSGDELKLVWPQPGSDWRAMEHWDFAHHLVQPMDGPDQTANIRLALDFVAQNPRWRLSLQTHKMIGIA
ncbi:MAG: 7-carboxy-7-deazaguanine synthase [Parasphingorhabdus sp.]|nr:7-carboxy-7-deazaguanine synthase [Parasphingorhabdus sp.]